MTKNIICPACKTLITRDQVRRRFSLKYNFIRCPVCDEEISIPDNEILSKRNRKLLNYVDISSSDRTKAATIYNEKKKNKNYDVLLIYNRDDRFAANKMKQIARALKARGILPWLDVWDASQNENWDEAFWRVRGKISRAFVFVGGEGKAPWEDAKIDSILRDFIKSRDIVLPVILDGESNPSLPIYLQNYGWGLIDIRTKERGFDPIDTLLLAAKGLESHEIYQPFKSTDFKEDLEVIRQSIGDRTLNQYYLLSRSIIRCLNMEDFKSIEIDGIERNSFFQVVLPDLGFAKARDALLFIRYKDIDDELRKKIISVSEEKQIDILIVVDYMDFSISPSNMVSKTIWLKPQALWDIASSTGNKNKIFSRYFLTQINLSSLKGFLPYQSEGYVTNLFFGRENELSELIKDHSYPGGIIVGAHLSGKTSLLMKLEERYKKSKDIYDDKHEIAPVVNLGNVGRISYFIKSTLKAIDINATDETTLEDWASAIQSFSKDKKLPIFLIDDANELIISDMNANFELGKYLRSLQYNNYCRFYISGHDALRRATMIQGSPYKNLSHVIILSGLNELAAKQLIEYPMLGIGFEISEKQIDRIIKGTAGIAVLIQEFCQRLLIKISESYHEKAISSIFDIKAKIENSEVKYVEDDLDFLEKVMEYFYDYAQTPEAKSILLILAIKGSLKREELFNSLLLHGFSLSRGSFNYAFDFLLKYKLLAEVEGRIDILPKYLIKSLKNQDMTNLINTEIERGRNKNVQSRKTSG